MIKTNFSSEKLTKTSKFAIGCSVIFAALAGMLILQTILYNYQKKTNQERLAQTLQVKIEDYPYPQSFPTGYFDSKLKSGMTTQEVHTIIKGYEKVFICEGSEIYYFYSKEDDYAKRYLVLYDQKGLFKEFQSVGRGGSGFNESLVKGCSERLPEP